MQRENAREALVRAAAQVFAEKGWDAASMRTIAERAGCSVGLSYHYFASKDEVLAQAADLLLADEAAALERLMVEAARNPFETAAKLLEAIPRAAADVERRLGSLHWTVRSALRDKALSMLEPQLAALAQAMQDWGMKPAVSGKALAHMLCCGVVDALLRIDPKEDEAQQLRLRTAAAQTFAMLMGMDAAAYGLLLPHAAYIADMDDCMTLARAEQSHFPGWAEGEFRTALQAAVDRGEALCMRCKGKVVGLCLYDAQRSEIDYLCVARAWRGYHAGMRLAVTAMAHMQAGQTAQLITFREDDEHGLAAVQFWRAMGFRHAEDLVSFDYPCQRMTCEISADLRAQVCIHSDHHH